MFLDIHVSDRLPDFRPWAFDQFISGDSMKIPFTKMHGAGNDFVMLNGMRDRLPTDLSAFSKEICHRQFGIGADQVLIAYASETADFRMDIYNADGGRVEMCGNGIRAFVRYLHEQKLSDKTSFTIETLAGLIRPELIRNHPLNDTKTSWVKVDMGTPILNGRDIPVDHDGELVAFPKTFASVAEAGFATFSKQTITCVSMGNPHCVIFVDDVQTFPVTSVGPCIENDAFFPKRVNVEFVQIVNRKRLIQRTWERGSGETLACGTGASAVCVAAVLNGLTDRSVQIELKGGLLELFWDETTGRVFKTGPAKTVFVGEISD